MKRTYHTGGLRLRERWDLYVHQLLVFGGVGVSITTLSVRPTDTIGSCVTAYHSSGDAKQRLSLGSLKVSWEPTQFVDDILGNEPVHSHILMTSRRHGSLELSKPIGNLDRTT